MATAVSARPTQNLQKVKRPQPPSLQTSINAVNSSISSPSPSLPKKTPSGLKHPPNSGISNSITLNGTGTRVSGRQRREVQRPGEVYGRQYKGGVGGRGGSVDGINLDQRKFLKKLPPQPYVNTTAHILHKYQGKPPSLTLHLHPTHFRFDQQDGSFGYNSPMKVILEYIRSETIPHDMMEEFLRANVKFYDDCLIVQIHDHRSILAPSSTTSSANASNGQKSSPFSVHNYNEHLTPSPYVAYTSTTQKPNRTNDKVDGASLGEKLKGPASTEQPRLTDQEKGNARATGQVAEEARSKTAKQPKIYTTVLHPTPLSLHADITILSSTPDPRFGDRRQSQQAYSMNGVTPTSGVIPHPPTPLTASTPLTSAPPHKKQKTILDDRSALKFESDYLICSTSPLYLKPAESARDAQMILDALKHPLHQNKPPPPKTRKRTVAELAADEALAAEEERFMLIMDERLSSISSAATAGAKSATGDGQATAASFEPRFSRFKVLESIKIKHEETRKKEKAELAKRQQTDMERERRRTEEEKARREQQLRMAQQTPQQPQPPQIVQNQQPQQQQPQQPQQQPQQQQQQQQQPQQQQQQHAHPQQNAIPANAHPQHIQQVTQGQQSSPTVRQRTPHVSSPVVGMVSSSSGSVPMMATTSSHGAGSPPRPPSTTQHHHPGVNATSHQMNNQRSQQGPSRNGTPQIVQATPKAQHTTPVMQQVTPTPRLSQVSAASGMGYTSAVPQHSINVSAPQMTQANLEQMQQRQVSMQQRAFAIPHAQQAQPQHRSPQPTQQQMASFHGQPHHPQQQQQQQFIQQQQQQQQQLFAQHQQQQQYRQMQMLAAQQQGLPGMPMAMSQQQQQQRLAQMQQQQRGFNPRQLAMRQSQIPAHLLVQQRGYQGMPMQAQQQMMRGGGGGMMGPMGGIPGQGRGI
ncbi:MAG: Transcription factor spt20 [Trichoglossum hirsutum]|nr:MAG: Transcription factor spt20 [Trichoglossum hirsutum]